MAELITEQWISEISSIKLLKRGDDDFLVTSFPYRATFNTLEDAVNCFNKKMEELKAEERFERENTFETESDLDEGIPSKEILNKIHGIPIEADTKEEVITDRYALYRGDCIQKMAVIPSDIVDMSIYSPPFNNMYTYSSSDHDLGNCKNYEEFLHHYEYAVREIFRLTKPGRMTCVHCMDIPKNGDSGLIDFPGDIIRLHDKIGFKFWDRKNIWKEPLRVAIRTRQRALMHVQMVTDTSKCRGALADYLLIFKKRGENKVPITQPYGLTDYAGDLELMNEIEKLEFLALQKKYVKYTDDKTNRLSQFIWRRYASSAWEDIRANVCLKYKEGRDKDDDRHVCPLPLDIGSRAVQLYTNPNEVVLVPFMGIGSEVYPAVVAGRKAIGIELKPTYFNQSVKNLKELGEINGSSIPTLFDLEEAV